ncbi:putative glycoside hydrolase [Candidatus Falkowbacteria bacterium]|nr:putative glycoside hydrolase [Candidatus Falkowbacteria bacterium]
MFYGLVNLAVVILTLGSSLFLTGNQGSFQVLRRPEKIEVKGIYLNGYTAGLKSRRTQLLDLVQTTELNALVIDIKDASGRIFFDTNIPLADQIGSEQVRIPDLKPFLAELKEKGIYSIARIVVFQDPYLASQMPEIALKQASGGLWHDYKGQAWVDPTQKLVWDYNLDLAKEAIKIGFDEINFDYIRFPSDGNIRQIVYANLENATFEGKSKAMAEFYAYVDKSLKFQPVITSADLFGMVLWRSDGLNIGQRYEDAALYFDYIAPMVYPSHYPNGFEGFANPAEHPYEIIHGSLIRAKDLSGYPFRAQLRPWLQAFDLGAVYTPEMIRLQKQAVYDAGGPGWMLWNASNRYTSGGLEPNLQ